MRGLAVVLLVLVLAGCGSGGTKIPETKLASLVLSTQEVGRTYGEFASGKQERADFHPGPRADPKRFGRLGGWIARFRHVGGSLEAKGPLVIESRADLFPSSAAAKKDLGAYAEEYEAVAVSAGGARLDAPAVGEDAVAFRYGGGLDRFFVVAWRRANATAAVVVEGAKVTFAEATALARKQDARLRRAA